MSGESGMDTSMEDARFANVATMSDDWYHGHKVVAMPSSAFGGMSIREVVSSRNENDQTHGNRPRRSNSLGRQPVRPGRDIIQDVYDRMGVSYTRGMEGYGSTPPRNLVAPDYGDPQQQEVPIGISTANSFSEISDFSNNSGSNIGNKMNPPPSQASRSNAGKIKDKFSGRYRAAAAVARNAPDRGRAGQPANPGLQQPQQNRGRAEQPRGRTVDPRMEEHESEGRRRARSLSRGLSVKGIWPPPANGAQPMDHAPVSKVPQNNHKNAPTPESGRNHIQSPPLPPQYQQQPPPPQQQPQQPQPPPENNRPKSPVKRSHSFDGRPQYGGGFRASAAMHNSKSRTQQTALHQDMSGNIREEKKDGDDRSATSEPSAAEEGSAGNPLPSIKDRISAFAGKPNPSQRSARRNTFAGTGYMKAASPPPKVDIYSRGNEDMPGGYYHPEELHDYGEEGGNDMLAGEDYSRQEPSNVPPSAQAAAAADAAAKLVRPSQFAKQKAANRHSAGNVQRSSIANSYLNGIQSSASNTTASSGRSVEDQNGGYGGQSGDGVSAASSQSHGGSGRGGGSWQKPGSYNSNQDSYNSNPSNKSNGSNTPYSGISGGDNISMEMVERMVDERVQVQLREVEARMEGLLRRWMDSMNTKITSRLDSMEQSIKASLPRHEI